MKDGVREGLHIKCKKEEKEFVSEQEEATFWEKKLLGTTSAKSLLNSIYFYNGKVFGLRGGDHRNIVVNNFEIGSNFIKGQMNQNFDLFYFSSILVECVQYEPNKHTMKFQLN